MSNISRSLLLGLFVLILISSCKPINILTRTKTLPREYTENYNVEGVKTPKTEANKKPWIVYSDRGGDVAYQNPGGRLKSADIAFLEPFMVIKQKGDYLQLIKYDPENVKYGMLKDRKKAKLVGWVHISRLVLSPSAYTNARTLRAELFITSISDTSQIYHPKKYFSTPDSIKYYDSPTLEKLSGTLGLNSIVYILKESTSKEGVLVAKSSKIEQDKIKEQVIGWVPRGLLQNIGDGVYLKTELAKGFAQPDPLKYSPVIQQYLSDTLTLVRSAVAKPIIDITRRKVFNVNGQAISYSKAQEIKDSLRQINIVFSIESTTHINEVYPMLLNVVYNTREKATDPAYRFNYGAVVNIGGNMYKLPLTQNFDLFCEWMTQTSDRYSANNAGTNNSSWVALGESVKLIAPNKNSNNIIVEIGETSKQGIPKDIISTLSTNNCRLLGWQIYSDTDEIFNNFVIELSQAIEQYADYQLVAKREQILYTNELRSSNSFKQYAQNQYMLDYPNGAITQGMVLFPEKKVMINIESLTDAIDTMLTQVKGDISNTLSSFDKSFSTIGSSQDIYDLSLTQKFNIERETKLNKEFANFFDKQSPMWVVPVGAFAVDSSQNNYRILLSKTTLVDFKKNIDALSVKEVDVKDVSKKSKESTKAIREYLKISESELSQEMLDEYYNRLAISAISDSSLVDSAKVDIVYSSTGKIRKHLISFYMSSLENCSVCKGQRKKFKDYTLAQAHRQIFGIPSNLPILNELTIRDLKDSDKLTDSQLDSLIKYYKKCKEEFEKKHTAEQFSSGPQTYYYIDSKLLP